MRGNWLEGVGSEKQSFGVLIRGAFLWDLSPGGDSTLGADVLAPGPRSVHSDVVITPSLPQTPSCSSGFSSGSPVLRCPIWGCYFSSEDKATGCPEKVEEFLFGWLVGFFLPVYLANRSLA